jgi:hypothetical protein
MAKIIAQITQDLHNTLQNSPGIKKVHFNSEGSHYFNVFELKNDQGNGTGDFYGGLKTEVREISIRDVRGKETQAMRMMNIANPKTLIVETLTREEALKLPTVKLEKATFIVNPLLPGSDMQPATKAVLKGAEKEKAVAQ